MELAIFTVQPVNWHRTQKKKGLIELEIRRFIDSATYFAWLKENWNATFHGDHETSPVIWAEFSDSKKEFIGGSSEFHVYMKEKYNLGMLVVNPPRRT